MVDIQNEYEQIKNDYDDFLNEVKRTVEKLLKRHQIPIAFGINGRRKDLVSIQEKAQRFTIKKTICELNDIVGLRIVLLFPEFKQNVIDLLCREFKLLNDPNKTQQLPDKFGYSSIHLILGIKDEWLKSPDWEGHADKKIEVQIRTVSEHVWAETSHSLFYKREENIPNIITRDLYRLAALLEVVDEKLQNIKGQVEHHFKHIRECSYEEILKMDLNSETFRRVMMENSKDIYSFNDLQNKELSSRIEHDYNILNIDMLDNLITEKIDLNNIDSDEYVRKVIEILEEYKNGIDTLEKEKVK